jgi:phage protein D/phage baseplate assembly protein gpV
MTTPSSIVSRIYIDLDGSEVQRPIMQKLIEVQVDQQSHLPDMFSIRFRDPGLEILDNGPFDLTKEVEIKAAKQDGEQVSLIKGEITAIEPIFKEGMILDFLVRGYDPSHRLYRETKSQAILNTKDSDLAEQIARDAGLQPEIDATSTVYDHVFQHNQSDLAFLMQRAWRIGYECFVSDGKLYFRQPPSESANITLTWGDDLLVFRPRMTLAEQVDEVLVKGWDVDRQEAIVGQANQGELYPEVGESQDGSSWSRNFGTGKKIIVNQPVTSQAEADILASARLNELSGAFIDAEGLAFRRPDIKAGQKVRLEALGNRFSGTYLVTNATHVYTTEGLKTTFCVRGSRTGLLNEQINMREPITRWTGVYTAIVTNTDDPNDWGRVKVMFPWLSNDAESNWARVLGIGAGPEAGIFVIPEVGDEVLVVFGHGDFSQPFVLGGVWNGQNALPPEGSGAPTGEKPLVRTWTSRSGHRISTYDNADEKVEIISAGGHSIILDDANSKIEFTSSSGLTITLDDNGSKVSFGGSSEVEVNTSGNLKLQAGGNIDLQASGQVNIQGAMINLN